MGRTYDAAGRLMALNYHQDGAPPFLSLRYDRAAPSLLTAEDAQAHARILLAQANAAAANRAMEISVTAAKSLSTASPAVD